ncbi:MAG: hypothetical protein ACI4S3_02965 [Candidatus Gastranaerophilaceae bacterium]
MSDNDAQNRKYGIHSLAGFAFQIKVFAYYALCITKENESIEFETIDDVNVKITDKNIDKKTDLFICKANYNDINNLIQVKRTKLSQEDFHKTLFNWILQNKNFTRVSKYILFSDKSYNNTDLMFNDSAEVLYSKAIKTEHSRSDSIEVQIKNMYQDKFEDFKSIYDNIQQNYEFIGNKDIDELIYEQAKHEFRYSTNSTLYSDRLVYYMNTIRNNIMNAIDKKEPYILSHAGLIKIYEDLNTSINDNNYYPPYYSYKQNLSFVTLSNSNIKNLRETKQLLACKLSEYNTLERLKQLKYYQHYRYLSLENGKESKPKSIEQVSFNNFNNVLEEIKDTDRDTPKNRLLETEKRNNSYAQNSDEIRCGSCIYLTGDNVQNQISWEDSNNAN